jgi:transposase
MSNEERLQQEVERQQAEIQRLNDKIDRLEHQLSVVSKQALGPRSEKTEYVTDEQISLFNEAEKESDGKDPTKEKKTVVKEHARKQKRTREELLKDLPTEDVVIPLPEEERNCPECGAQMEPIGKEYVRQELVWVPSRCFVRNIYAEVLKCPSCGTDESKDTALPDIEKAQIRKAQVPAAMIPKSFCSPELLAHIICEKYVNAMPLYRQEKDFKAKKIPLSRTTMANWIIYAARTWFEPVYTRMKKELLSSHVIHADETVVQVLKEPGKKAQTESRMWVYCSGAQEPKKLVLYEYQPTRNGDHAKRFLGDFSGILVTDGFAGYNKLTNVTHAGCWAHVRRYFVEALPKDKEAAKESKAAKAIEYIDSLFAAERDVKDVGKLRKIREETSRNTVDEFYEWLGTFTANGAGLQKAVGYAVSMKKWLTAFLDDPTIPLSNNRAENAIRPFVVGRKNWLFSDTVNGAKSSAVIYSLIETAKANGINVEQYLVSLLKNEPSTR